MGLRSAAQSPWRTPSFAMELGHEATPPRAKRTFSSELATEYLNAGIQVTPKRDTTIRICELQSVRFLCSSSYFDGNHVGGHDVYLTRHNPLPKCKVPDAESPPLMGNVGPVRRQAVVDPVETRLSTERPQRRDQ